MGPQVKELLAQSLDRFTGGESLVKIVRQLDFWYGTGDLTHDRLLDLTRRLIERASIVRSTDNFVCPKVRYGKTELQVPILTCGLMRVQYTWMPDFVPFVAPRPSHVLHSPSQDNLVQLVRWCLKHGLNHFETARYYGTSEYQVADALYTMIQAGEIQRSDVILQTKIPVTKHRDEFEKQFAQCWAHLEKLEYIDLLTFHCISKAETTEWALSDDEQSCMAAVLEYQTQGKIRHFGFSTHGTAKNILELIESKKFAYVNLHYHYLGSYHAEGTPDGHGGHGNARAVQRALELDMGVFNISPLDKGGMMYRPSTTLAKTLGSDVSPIDFSLLTAWHKHHFHTASVGLARVVDLEDCLYAARLFAQDKSNHYNETHLRPAMDRIQSKMLQSFGMEWYKGGLINVPDCEQESTHGTGIGHVLWCYNVIASLGMFEFAQKRYSMLLKTKWDDKKSFAENSRALSGIPEGNMGRAYLPGMDYRKALSDHVNATSAVTKLQQVHTWMTSTSRNDNDQDDDDTKGWKAAYDLRVWDEFPGDSVAPHAVLLQCFTRGWLGCGGGPTAATAALVANLEKQVR